jgi:hypothetical protein
LTNKQEEAGLNPLPFLVFIYFSLHLAGDYCDIIIIIIIIVLGCNWPYLAVVKHLNK